MTPRSLFNIILKIFGLFFLKEIIGIIPQLISTILLFINSSLREDFYITLFIIAAITAFYCFISYQLLFKTNYILDKLKLDQGFKQERFSFDALNPDSDNDKFSLNLSTPVVLTISLLVIAGILLINEIPIFCKLIYAYFEEKQVRFGMPDQDYSMIIISIVKIIIALLLIGERKRIIDLVIRKQGEKDGPNEEEADEKA